MVNIQDKLQKQLKKLSAILIDFATNYKLVGEWNKARELIQFGLKSDISDIAKAELQIIMAEIFLKQANFTQAEKLLAEAQKIAESEDNRLLLGSINYWLGERHYIYRFMKEESSYETSLEFHNSSLIIREQINDLKGMARSLSRIGVIYERQGDFETAMEFHKKSLKTGRKIRYPPCYERAVIHLGAYEERNGNLQEALKYYQQAMDIYMKYTNEEDRSFGLMNLGGIYYKINNDKDEFQKYLEEALIIAEKLGHKIAICFMNYRLGMFYSEIGEKGRAIEILQNLIEIARPIGFKFVHTISKNQIDKLKSE
ncbi:MAG: tetratricopeptide repeat protein [Asgard group archaeon]|nr:tetratricopeptide repeat protein [Asgard group archaeon]